MLRRVVLTLGAVAGVLAALIALARVVESVWPGERLHFDGASALLALPVCILGAMAGSLLGSLLVPPSRA